VTRQVTSTVSKPSIKTIKLLFGALLLWGLLLAAGVSLFHYDVERQDMVLQFRPLGGVIVLGCVLAFLGFWGLLLWHRRRRTG